MKAGLARPQRNRLPEVRNGRCAVALLVNREREVVLRRVVVGKNSGGGAIFVDGAIPVAALAERVREVEAVFPGVGRNSRRPLELLDCIIELTLTLEREAQPVQRL